MAIGALGGIGVTQGRADLFQLRLEKAREATAASNQEFIAAAKQSGETASADFNRVSYAQISTRLGAADGFVYTTDLQRVADLATEDAGKRLDSALRLNGLSGVSPPPKFGVDRNGQLSIEHPRKAEIEAALASDPTLAQDLRDAINLQAGAARTQADSLYASAYQQAYRTAGPEAAGALAQRYQALVGPDVTLSFSRGRLETSINGGSQSSFLQQVSSALGLERGGLANLRA